ncbi:hypothetical protein [Pseudomonas sp.]|uniref:hypothetical protein n=1 Tax=Pseudomonas sp. TaxID=306 RepID=UPI00263615B4|nr:hypothetical protein [Pseudomonas sp.]
MNILTKTVTRKIKKRAAWATIIFPMLLASGCGATDNDKFTLKTAMPANFKLEADGYYIPATAQECKAPWTRRKYVADRESSTSGTKDSDYTAVLHIPLKVIAGDCPLILGGLKLDIEGKWGPGMWDVDGVKASISIRDKDPGDSEKLVSTESTILNGECQWFFRTMGPKRFLAKVMKCSAIDKNGQVLKYSPGGSIQRDKLPGQTINMSIRLADTEKPYYKGFWFKAAAGGWKPCDANWGRDMEEECLTPPKFKNFIMPDGRDCSVYPTCTE